MKPSKLFFLLAIVAFLLPASAQTINLTTLGSLDGTNGAKSRTGLTEGTNGNFYGVGYTGGSNNLGTVFERPPGGPPANLYSFSGGTNSASPTAPLLLGRDGYLYGEMPGGGTFGFGYIFRMSHAGALTNIASFDGFSNGGVAPSGGLMQGQDGNFYGTCQQAGGAGPNFNGCIFMMKPDGTLSNLYAFFGTNYGSMPYAGLVQTTNGDLFGTTLSGGTNGNFGTIFKLATNGVFTSLFSFNKTNGANPRATLALGLDGNLYGTTVGGGTNAYNGSYGTVFRITPGGSFTSLASFDGNINGASPYGGLVAGNGGSFYGTTSGGDGTIFQVTTNGILTTVYEFTYDEDFNYPNGNAPECTLVRGTDGNFYGTTQYGGDDNLGTVFSFSVVSPAPVILSVGQAGGTLNFTWSAVSNSNYQVQSSTNLAQTNWMNLGSSVTATNSVMSGTDAIGPGPQRFYRIFLLP